MLDRAEHFFVESVLNQTNGTRSVSIRSDILTKVATISRYKDILIAGISITMFFDHFY